MNAAQSKMARAALDLGVRELATLANVSPDTIARLERGVALKAQTVDAIRSALEAAGVIFIEENGEGPGVRLKKAVAMEARTDQECYNLAKAIARDWTTYCKGHNSMAFAEGNRDLILIKLQSLQGQISNVETVQVLPVDFEIEGRRVGKDELERRARDIFARYPYRL